MRTIKQIFDSLTKSKSPLFLFIFIFLTNTPNSSERYFPSNVYASSTACKKYWTAQITDQNISFAKSGSIKFYKKKPTASFLCNYHYSLKKSNHGIIKIDISNQINSIQFAEGCESLAIIVCMNSFVTVNPTTGQVPILSAGVRLLSLFRVFEHQVELELKHGLSFYSSKAAKNRL